MSNFQIFARLAKYDEETGIFEAIAANETIDKAGERFHYKSSKPYFEKWSSEIAKATGGKSVGNVRSMHGKNASGKLTDLTCDDEASAIKVRGKIVDPVDKVKMSEGVYSGVSIGGDYVKKWQDDENPGVKWYTADPAEISIVDNPCGNDSYFTYVKADGSQELRKFHTVSGSDAAPEAGHTPPSADGTATASEPVSKSAAAEVDGATATPSTPADPAAAAALTKRREPFLKRAEALSKNEAARGTLDALRSAYGLPAVEKGLYDVAELADLLSWLTCLADFAESEAMWEGDNSKVPEELRASVAQLGQILLDMAQEEVAEAVGEDAEVEVIIELAAKVGELRKRNTDKITQALDALTKALVPEPAKPQGLSKVQRAVLDETTHALSKARAENETLRKRVDELEKLPSAKAPVLRMVGKGEGESMPVGTGAPEETVKPVIVGGQIDKAATAIKQIHAQQMRK